MKNLIFIYLFIISCIAGLRHKEGCVAPDVRRDDQGSRQESR